MLFNSLLRYVFHYLYYILHNGTFKLISIYLAIEQVYLKTESKKCKIGFKYSMYLGKIP